MARNLLESISLLANVSRVFADRCVAGIEADVERCRAYAESSPSIGTSLNPYIGYEKAAEVIKESVKTGRSIREIVLERKLMPDAELDRALDVLALTKGGITRPSSWRARARRACSPDRSDGLPSKGLGSPGRGMTGWLQLMTCRGSR